MGKYFLAFHPRRPKKLCILTGIGRCLLFFVVFVAVIYIIIECGYGQGCV